MKLLIAFALAVAIPTALAACAGGDVYNKWMRDIATARGGGWTGKRLNQVTLMGSHDAVTNTNAHHAKPWYYKWAWADTQEKSIEEQLCAGARFFDLRFKQSGNDQPSAWRGHHGGAKYYTADDVFGQVKTFGDGAGRNNEIVLLRLKLKPNVNDNQRAGSNTPHQAGVDAFVNWACMKLGDNCAFGDRDSIHDKTLAVLADKTDGTHAAVFLMLYDEYYTSGTISPGAARTRDVVKFYSETMTGRYSERIPVNDIVKGQQVNYGNKDAKLFGWWMTATPHTKSDKLKRLAVKPNTAPLMSPGGSHRGWITDLLNNRDMAGCTIITDFVGTAGFADVMVNINAYNDNIAQNRDGKTGIAITANTALVYAFTEEEATVSSTTRTPCNVCEEEGKGCCVFCDFDAEKQPKDKSCCLACESPRMDTDEACCLVAGGGGTAAKKGFFFKALRNNH